jgi:hypothetical protein
MGKQFPDPYSSSVHTRSDDELAGDGGREEKKASAATDA